MLCFAYALFVLFSATIAPAQPAAGGPAAPIAPKSVVSAIVADLTFFTPNVTIGLTGERMSPGIAALERAGILEKVASGPDGTVSLMLTNKGERIAADRGWSVRFSILTITTGSLQYVPNSYRARAGTNNLKVTYLWRYVPNGNVEYLLKMAPLSSWPQSMYPSCVSPHGAALPLVNRRTVLFWPDGFGGWESTNAPSERFAGCVKKQ